MSNTEVDRCAEDARLQALAAERVTGPEAMPPARGSSFCADRAIPIPLQVAGDASVPSVPVRDGDGPLRADPPVGCPTAVEPLAADPPESAVGEEDPGAALDSWSVP